MEREDDGPKGVVVSSFDDSAAEQIREIILQVREEIHTHKENHELAVAQKTIALQARDIKDLKARLQQLDSNFDRVQGFLVSRGSDDDSSGSADAGGIYHHEADKGPKRHNGW